MHHRNMAKTRLELRIAGMTCQGCVRTIEKKLSTVVGVDYAHVNLGAGKAVVEYDDARTQPDELIRAVEQVGFQASRN
jgi:copper ion binding protein